MEVIGGGGGGGGNLMEEIVEGQGTSFRRWDSLARMKVGGRYRMQVESVRK